ncbi:Rib/alpha-like domain-containing protein, partial [Lactobacillus intestinalis]
ANEASTFNKAQLVPLVKIPVGTKIDPADTTNAQAALKDPSQIGKTITSIQYVTIPDTSKPRNIFETPVKITFNDGSTKTFEQAIQITSEADNYTGTPQNIDILHNITIDPENTNNAKGAATDPDNTIDHIQFVDPKDIDPSTLGKQIAPAIITFKDGSTKTISVPVTIVPNEADKFSPNDLNKPITVKKNTPISKGAEVADAINPIKKTQDNVTSITYETVPDTTVPGTTYPAVKVTFNDGSSITTNLPVVVSTTKTGNPYQAGTQGVNDASNYYIYREIMIHRPDSDQEDIVTQVIHFIRKDKNGNSSYTTDGKTTYVPWTVADSDGHSTGTATGHFKEYETPRVADYAANKSLIADEEVAGDPYGATPVSRDRVEKVDINYNFDMNQVSMAYLAVPASFTPGDNLFLQLAAYDNKTGKQIKLPRSVKFEAKSLPDGVKLDEQTGSVTVPKGMQVGKNQVQVMALAQTGQKEVDAQLNVVNKPDSGQTTPTTPVNPTPITPSTPTTPTTPTKQTDADKFAPQTQDITTTVDDLPDASSAISNLDNLPSGTKASWQTAPEVSQSGSKTANIVVTYPDGSQDTTSTTVIVAEKVPEKKAIVPIGQKIKTKKNVLPKPIKGIKNRKLMPVGTKYAWKKKPNVSKIGTIKAIVKVTYPNGKKFNIKVKIIVSDVIKTHASTTVDHLPSASSMLENAPAGTKAHWIKKPDVSKPGQAKGRIGIDYPNGQKEKKDVFISVKPGNSLSMNSTKHVERSSSHSPKSESYAYNSHLGASTNGTSGRQASVKAESINGFTSSSSPSPLAEIGRQGQIRANKNLRSELGKNNSENVKNNTNSKELPETGEKDSELEALGMMAASLSLIGLAGVKKRKH